MAIRREVKMEKIKLEELKTLYYDKGLILKEIALSHNTTVGQLRKIMKRHGMKIMRGPSKYRKIIVSKSLLPLSLSNTDLNIPEIPDITLQIILGALMGDSNIRIRQNKHNCAYNIQFGHSKKQLGYLKYKHALMCKDLLNPINKEREENKCFIVDKFYDRQAFYTFCTKPINIDYIYNLLYKNNKKIVNEKYLGYLTPLSLAIWYMDDGSYNLHNRIIRFATMGFTREENEIIRDYFYNNLKMPCVVAKVDSGSGWSIMLPQNSTKKFINLVKPYKCECMNYKFPIDPSETLKAKELSFVSKGSLINSNNAEHPGVNNG